MKQIPDRKMLRREYLMRRIHIHWRQLLFGIHWLSFPLVIYASYLGRHRLGEHSDQIWPFVCIFWSLVFIGALVQDWRRIQRLNHEADLSYAPPIKHVVFPTDEILVRASEAPPVVQSEALLRAAQEHKTPQEELLRANQGSVTQESLR
jgi:hypothetical protein